jgi:hypothetical protein
MIGCLTPDISYSLGRVKLDQFAHTFLGGLGFCLPAGVVCAAVFYAVRRPLAAALPPPHRQALLTVCDQPRPPWWTIVASVLIGAWSHVALDALTRESKVMILQWPELAAAVAPAPLDRLPLYRLLWCALSAAGLGWLALAYRRFLKRTMGRSSLCPAREWGRTVGWTLLVIGPLPVIVPFMLSAAKDRPWLYGLWCVAYDTLAVHLVVVSLLLVALGLVLRFACPPPRIPQDGSWVGPATGLPRRAPCAVPNLGAPGSPPPQSGG